MGSSKTISLVLVVIVAMIVLALIKPRAEVLVGYAAKGRDLDDVLQHELAGFPWFLATTTIQGKGGNRAAPITGASASIWWVGSAKTAVLVPGFGCVLVQATQDSMYHPAVNARTARLAASGGTPRSSLHDTRVAGTPTAPWPVGEAVDEAKGAAVLERSGVDAAALADVVQRLAFDESDPVEKPIHTRAVVVLHKGQVVHEQYGHGRTPESLHAGWSMTKSVLSALVGVRVRQGRMTVDDTAICEEWGGEGDPRAAITLDSMLRMSSGLRFLEQYSKLSVTDVSRMLFASKDVAKFAAGFPLDEPVGSKFSYSSGTSNMISRYLRQSFVNRGGDKTYWRFPYDQLFSKINARSFVMETDESGTFVGSSFLHGTARDWARFGQLYLNDGVWEGERVLPEGWVAATRTPTPPSLHTTAEDKLVRPYGVQWWLNNEFKRGDATVKPLPTVPADAYYCHGYEHQVVLVVPSKDLVVVRMGVTKKEEWWPMAEFLGNVTSLFPDVAAGATPASA